MTITFHSLDQFPIGLSPQELLAARSDIEKLARHIRREGLLNPIIAQRDNGRWIIRDGKKRLAALKLLARKDMLPRSLMHIPVAAQPASDRPGRPALRSDAELARDILAANAAGKSALQRGRELGCDDYCVARILGLKTLHPQIFDYFLAGHIKLDQATAFASMPSHDAQWRLLIELGPFARSSQIIAKILTGETVIETPDGNVHILPSRAPSMSIAPAPRRAA